VFDQVSVESRNSSSAIYSKIWQFYSDNPDKFSVGSCENMW
jgi:hypothetical protein